MSVTLCCQIAAKYSGDTLTSSFAIHISSFSQCGYTPLLTACEYQKLNVVKYLAEVDEVNFSVCCAIRDSGIDEEGRQGGMTGLHLAAIHDSPEIASLLIEKGCPINGLDKEVNNTEYVSHVVRSAGQ